MQEVLGNNDPGAIRSIKKRAMIDPEVDLCDLKLLRVCLCRWFHVTNKEIHYDRHKA